MNKIINFLTGQILLDKVKSPINGEIEVWKDLVWGNYIKVGGITQSGGIVKDIWKETLSRVRGNKINSLLILGLGGGTIVEIVRKYWPKADIVGVDIDPEIVELGKKYLNLKSVTTKIIDAEDYLEKNKKQFDLVIVDLYQGRDFPEKFKEEKFLKLLSKYNLVIVNRLYSGGVRTEAIKFGVKLEKIFSNVEYYYPQANLMFICS